MLLLDACSIPNAEFACLSLLMDNSALNLEPFTELASVSSPLATTAPAMARSCLAELHEYLNLKLSKQPPFIMEGGDKDINRNGDANGAETLNGTLNKDVEKGLSNESSKAMDAETTVNDNEHLSVPLPCSHDSSSLFHKLCMEEDRLHNMRTFHSRMQDYGRCDTYQSKNGLTLEYILVQDDDDLVQKCLFSFLKLAKGSSSTTLLPIHGIVITIGVKGPIDKIPYYFAIHEPKQRLLKFSATFRMMNFSQSSKEQKRDVELMLLSIITDQDSLKTNEQFEAEYGNDFDIEQIHCWRERVVTNRNCFQRNSHSKIGGEEESTRRGKKIYQKMLFPLLWYHLLRLHLKLQELYQIRCKLCRLQKLT
jgi:hypothetical protein